MSWVAKNKAALIFSIAVGAFIVFANLTSDKPPAAYNGDAVRIVSGKNSAEVPVATTKEAEAEFSKALNNKDTHAYNQLFADGKMIRIPAGTKAMVIDRSMNMAQVRILEGSHEGRAGWVPVEFAVKETPTK